MKTIISTEVGEFPIKTFYVSNILEAIKKGELRFEFCDKRENAKGIEETEAIDAITNLSPGQQLIYIIEEQS